jgi:hypothetical protein
LTGRNHALVTELIRSDLLAGAQEFGHFVKFPGSPAVDASLLGLYYSGLAEKQPGWKPALDLKIQTAWNGSRPCRQQSVFTGTGR